MGFIDRLLREGREQAVVAAALQAEAAIKRQHRIAEDIRHRGIHSKVGKHMQHRMIIDPVLAAQLRRRYGEYCFSDPKFVDSLLRDNPMLRLPK